MTRKETTVLRVLRTATETLDDDEVVGLIDEFKSAIKAVLPCGEGTQFLIDAYGEAVAYLSDELASRKQSIEVTEFVQETGCTSSMAYAVSYKRGGERRCLASFRCPEDAEAFAEGRRNSPALKGVQPFQGSRSEEVRRLEAETSRPRSGQG